MRSKEFSFIVLRVLAIYIFIQSIIGFSEAIIKTIIPSLHTFKTLKNLNVEINQPILDLLLASIIPSVVLLIISILLWIFTNRISKFLLPKDTANEDGKEINLNNVQVMIFASLGVIIVSLTLPQLFNLIANIIKMNKIGFDLATTQFKMQTILPMIGQVVKLLIGFALIIWSKGLTRLLNRKGMSSN